MVTTLAPVRELCIERWICFFACQQRRWARQLCLLGWIPIEWVDSGNKKCQGICERSSQRESKIGSKVIDRVIIMINIIRMMVPFALWIFVRWSTSIDCAICQFRFWCPWFLYIWEWSKLSVIAQRFLVRWVDRGRLGNIRWWSVRVEVEVTKG